MASMMRHQLVDRKAVSDFPEFSGNGENPYYLETHQISVQYLIDLFRRFARFGHLPGFFSREKKTDQIDK